MKNKKLLTALICMALLVCTLLVCIPTASAAGKFTDVPEKSWYTAAVLKANELGIMNGTSDTTFAPLKNLTRAEYVAILFRLSGGEENLPFTFTDVPEKAWYKKYVGWAEQSGVITGYGNPETFGGNELITREQLMLMTSRYMKYEWVSFEDSATAVEFADRDKIAKWAADGVEVTRKAGLITGDKNANFNPKNPATRAEIATIVVRYVDALPSAKDPMHMKFDSMLELVECDGKSPILKFGKALPVLYNRGDAFGLQLLPQMDLDTEKYRIIMETGAFRSFVDSYKSAVYVHELQPGESKSILGNVSIKNVETGEETTKKTFLFKVCYETVVVDPETYDVGIPEDVHADMMEASFYSMGNVARLAKQLAEAEAGKDLNVVYIGGSLTAAGTTDINGNWVSGTTAWFTRKFPNAKVTGVNSGWGGTGSNFGNVRFESQVLDHDPDIIFIEFAVNDGSDSDDCKRRMEALVRRGMEYGDDTAIVLLLTALPGTSTSFENCRNMHKALAAHYDIPVIDFHAGLQNGMSTGLFDFTDLSMDNCHLITWGYQIELDMVEYMLENICKKIDSASAADLKIKPLPTTPFIAGENKYLDLVSIDKSDYSEITSFGSWKEANSPYEDDAFGKGLACNGMNGNDPLEFSFTGTDLYIIMYEGAEIEVSLNNGEYVAVYGSDTGAPYDVFTDLPEKEYKVKITIKNPSADAEALIYVITHN